MQTADYPANEELNRYFPVLANMALYWKGLQLTFATAFDR